MARPLLLDLFCGAGGAAMGYHRAGFDVLGVDRVAQPRYPFAFVQADAITYPLDGFDVIHASPPCQAHSSIGRQARGRDADLEHPDLIPATRARLVASGLLYVIENVVGAPLVDPVLICGSSVGLDVRRHRLFETNWPLFVPPCAHGWQTPRFETFDRRKRSASVVPVYGGGNATVARKRAAMGIDWMTGAEVGQAIPPAYT
jgi:DNA (cytosine-5)-methyltransferase 1